MRKFMRTRGAAPQPRPHSPQPHDAPEPNGHAAGARPPPARRRCGGAEGGTGGAGLWEDEQFPPGAAALGQRRAARLPWPRPPEVCARPRFLGDEQVEGPREPAAPEPAARRAARWEVAEGAGAMTALAAAAAALAHTPQLLARVVPPQSFHAHYTGVFRFQFWVWGEWREVAVDDRLPPAPRGRTAPDDFTLPLLEKAYAKLHGSYAAARAASDSALQELVGGVLQRLAPPRLPRAALLAALRAALPRATLLVARAAPGKCSGARRRRGGPAAGRAYLVTGLAGVAEDGGEAAGGALVRLRVASGAGGPGEWPGAAPASRASSAADLELAARLVPEPGHFWMPVADFVRSFSRLELVHVGPDDWLGEPALHARRPWRAVLARRRWRAGYNAGGPPGGPMAHTNPQFYLSVPQSTAGPCHVVVSVTQQYEPGARAEPLERVGFAVYELPPGAAPRRAALAPRPSSLRALDAAHAGRAREVAALFTLPPGQYLLVPHSRANRDGAFLLRVLTDRHTDVWEVNDDNVIVRDVAAEVRADPRALPAELQAAVAKVMRRLRSGEASAAALRAAVRGAGAGARAAWGRPSLEACRALVALRDAGAAGRVAARELPALLALLAAWRAAWRARPPAPDLRALLWACGLSASNKVLECVAVRYVRGAALPAAALPLALARLHLAHERFRSLDAKMKSNPLSLEEMILMTVYS